MATRCSSFASPKQAWRGRRAQCGRSSCAARRQAAALQEQALGLGQSDCDVEVLPNSMRVGGPEHQRDPNGWKTLVGLACVVAVICAVDRGAMSVAILPMSIQFGWDDSTKGLIGSAFLAGYMTTNLVGGYLSTRYRPKRVLATGVVVWSLFTVATPLAAQSGSLPLLLLCRFLMGAGEGVTFPSVQELVNSNVPSSATSRALTLIYSGAQAGTIVSFIVAPGIIDQASLGWPGLFYIFGSLGLVWLLFWVPLVSDVAHAHADRHNAVLQRPIAALQVLAAKFARQAADAARQGQARGARENGPIDAAAPEHEASARPASERTLLEGSPGSIPSTSGAAERFNLRDVPWREVLSSRPFWAVLTAHSAFGCGHYMVLAWLPTYFFQEYGLDVRNSAWLSALPYLASIAATNVGGWAADGVVNGGVMSQVNIRKLLQMLAGFGPGACLLYLAAASNHDTPALSLMGAVGIMTLMLGLGGFSGAGFASNHSDLTQRYTGILFGITAASSSACGALSTYATGVALDLTHSWALVFEVIAMVYIGSSVVFAAWASSTNQFDHIMPRTKPAGPVSGPR